MHVFCFSHTWYIFNLNTIFINCKYTLETNTYTRTSTFKDAVLLADPPCFPLCLFYPPCMSQPPLFYLLGDPSFGDCGSNVHPPSSPVSDQLFTPCCLTLPEDTPWFMLHVYIDDITTSATLSDTCLIL